MRGGKDEEKLVTPMFPRLHVNDKEKGGPRAPPRNKMALYEQLSVPSQRFVSKSPSMLPLRADVCSTSSSHVAAHQSSIFTPLCNSPARSHQAEKLRSSLFSGVNLNNTMGSNEQNSMKPKSYQSLNATGPLSSTVESKSFQSHKFSIGDKDDCRIPAPARGIGPHCLGLSSSVQLQNASEKRISGTDTIDMSSREFVRKQAEEQSKVSQSNLDPVERSASNMSTRDKNLADTSSTSSPKLNRSESFQRAQRHLNQGNRSSLVDNFNRLQGTNATIQQENVAVQDKIVLGDDILVEPAKDIGKENASKWRGESCSRPSLGDDNRSPIRLVNGSDCREDKRCESIQVGDVDRHDDVSDSSMVHSLLALDISPDDVVGVIGVKKFWKARRAIVNQQRVFAVQVFELHRLIKVQRYIAGSPHILLEDNLFLGKPSLKVSPVKNLPSVYPPEPPSPLLIKAKDISQKANPSTKCAGQNAVGMFPLPSLNNDTTQECVTPQSNYAHYSGNPPPVPASNNTKSPPCCLHPPPANQWLVPVMSPSEGLVYKPYTGPCPPTAVCMAPMYGNCGPMSLNPRNRDFLNTAYGVPVSHPEIGVLQGTPLGQTYVPPYGSAVNQISPFPGAWSNEQDSQLSIGDINFTIPQQSSCSVPGQVSQVIPCHVGKFPASKESELQGSTGSSPSERARSDTLALFPMTSTVQASDQNVQTGEHRAQVIKVVPHNARSATESAARIFMSIQEERKGSNCD